MLEALLIAVVLVFGKPVTADETHYLILQLHASAATPRVYIRPAQPGPRVTISLPESVKGDCFFVFALRALPAPEQAPPSPPSIRACWTDQPASASSEVNDVAFEPDPVKP